MDYNYNNNLMPRFDSSNWSVVSGGAIISDVSVTLKKNSIVKLILDSSEVLLSSEAIKLVIGFGGLDDIGYPDYVPKSEISMKVIYKDDDGSEIGSGIKSSKNILFNNTFGSSDYNVDETEILMENKNIDELNLYFKNIDNNEDIVIDIAELYKSINVNSKEIDEKVESEVETKVESSLKKYNTKEVNFLADGSGVILKLSDDEDLRCLYVTDDQNRLIGLESNGESIISISYDAV